MLRKLLFLIFSALASLLVSSGVFAYANTPAISSAYNSRIIDDLVFINSGTMGVVDIQNFLNSKVPVCDTNHAGGATNQPPPYVCLKDYVDPTTGKKAAQLIYDEATTLGLNPQVILATLQKEQGLVTDTWPYPSQYKSAMGYGCPESQSVCDSAYYGIYNQVHLGTKLLRVGYDRDCGNFTSFGGQAGWYINPKWRLGNTPPISSTDGRATQMQSCANGALYNYTPHRPDSAYTLSQVYNSNGTPALNPDGTPVLSYYYGNYNFINYFSSWFGSTLTPSVLKSSSNDTVYLYASGYKIQIPSMALLQDYGFNPGAINVYPQSYVDSLPVPDQASGVSASIGYVIKTPSDSDGDGPTAYLVSVGKKYPISSMQQFADFGFSTNAITYLPESFVAGIPSGSTLSNYISIPGSTVFQVIGGLKRIIFDEGTYIKLNPGGLVTPASTFFATTLTSGLPIVNREVLVRLSTGAIHLFKGPSYYSLPSMDAYQCWGFGGAQTTPLYQPSDDGYVATITNAASLSCTTTDSQGVPTLLNRTNKYTLPTGFGVSNIQTTPSDVMGLLNNLPTASAPLGRAIKTGLASTVWYIEGGIRKAIPSMSNLTLLGFSASQINILDDSAARAIPASGIKLGPGQVVKTAGGAGVFIISGNTRVLFNAADDFLAYRYGWADIETYADATLDQYYPYSSVKVNRYLYNQANGKPYLVDVYGCFVLDGTLLADYGQVQSDVVAKQQFDIGIFTKLSLPSCAQGTKYAKMHGQDAVYWVNGGTKSPFASWSRLLAQNGGTVPVILDLNPTTLQAIPTGQTLQ